MLSLIIFAMLSDVKSYNLYLYNTTYMYVSKCGQWTGLYNVLTAMSIRLSYCMTNCTGWIYRSESTISSARLSTVVCSARLRHTWRISAHRSPISPVGSIYFRLAATSSSFHATVARSSAVGPLLRVGWPGTHCLTASEIRLCQPALSDVI